MAAMTEQLTILTTGGGAATKIVTRREDGSYHFTPYSAGYLFRWADIQIRQVRCGLYGNGGRGPGTPRCAA